MTSLMARDTSALAGSAYANSGRAPTTLGRVVTAEASVRRGDGRLSGTGENWEGLRNCLDRGLCRNTTAMSAWKRAC
jgi:hypothetical protein